MGLYLCLARNRIFPADVRAVPVLPGRDVPEYPWAVLSLRHDRRRVGGHRAITARAGLAGRPGRLAGHLLPP